MIASALTMLLASHSPAVWPCEATVGSFEMNRHAVESYSATLGAVAYDFDADSLQHWTSYTVCFLDSGAVELVVDSAERLVETRHFIKVPSSEDAAAHFTWYRSQIDANDGVVHTDVQGRFAKALSCGDRTILYSIIVDGRRLTLQSMLIRTSYPSRIVTPSPLA